MSEFFEVGLGDIIMFYDDRFPPDPPPEPIHKNDNEYDFAWRGPVNNLKPLDVIFNCEGWPAKAA